MDPANGAIENDETGEGTGDQSPSGIPWMPLFIYLTAVLFYGLWVSDGNLYFRFPPRTGWLFVPVFLYLGVGSLATGRAPLRGTPIRREVHPKPFWAVTGLYFVLALAMALMGLGLFE